MKSPFLAACRGAVDVDGFSKKIVPSGDPLFLAATDD
jgi:hypothetical protein